MGFLLSLRLGLGMALGLLVGSRGAALGSLLGPSKKTGLRRAAVSKLSGGEAQAAPDPINSQGLVTSMAPDPINS